MSWYETCTCKSRLDASISNDRQRWNIDKCKCQCEELIDKDGSDDGFNLSLSLCECQCNKPCEVGKYKSYKSKLFQFIILLAKRVYGISKPS